MDKLLVEAGDLKLTRNIPFENEQLLELRRKNKVLIVGFFVAVIIGGFISYKLYKKNKDDEK